MGKLTATVLAAAAIAVTFTGTAQAETNPRCSTGVTKIGDTKYLKSGSKTVASVKQFKGCNKNWGYIYVWDSWKADHPNFVATVAVTTGDGGIDTDSGARGQQEVWSRGARTLNVCTQVYGTVSGGHAGFTEERC
ncbi:hypothetical protein LFM09_16570 [Lentzea alba]|uniref:hypothetical protein n=1 Tax=Lentzea alba TaxID=2714351 RepID=UPI0039BF1D5A